MSGICSDGLYQDYNNKERFTFRGENPNNYITFNGEKAGWRIISVEVDGTVKIIRINSIGNLQWHDTCAYRNDVCHNWSKPAYLNTYLNNTYYNQLSDTAKKQIVSKDYSVIETTFGGQNESVTWNEKIALAEIDDLQKSTSEWSRCATMSVTYFNCDTWLDNNTDWWLLDVPGGGLNDPENSYAYFYNSTHSGVVTLATSSVTDSYGVKPTVYLSSSVKITGGNGSQSNPYVLG